MVEPLKPRILLAFTLPLAALIALASGLGLFWAGAYAREAAFYAAQGVGQDAVNLIVVVPALIVSALLAVRGSRISFQAWGGVIFYCAYSYVIYTFSMHFGPLFLVYCAILGLSVYSLVYYFSICSGRAREWYDEKTPTKAASGFLIFITAAIVNKRNGKPLHTRQAKRFHHQRRLRCWCNRFDIVTTFFLQIKHDLGHFQYRQFMPAGTM